MIIIASVIAAWLLLLLAVLKVLGSLARERDRQDRQAQAQTEAQTDVSGLGDLDCYHAAAVVALRPFFAAWEAAVNEEAAS